MTLEELIVYHHDQAAGMRTQCEGVRWSLEHNPEDRKTRLLSRQRSLEKRAQFHDDAVALLAAMSVRRLTGDPEDQPVNGHDGEDERHDTDPDPDQHADQGVFPPGR